jgi:phosphonate transport system permease protein
LSSNLNRSAALGNNQYSRPTRGFGIRHLVTAIAFVAIFVLSWHFAEVRPTAIFEPGAAAGVWKFLRSLFPPDLSLDFLKVVGAAIVQTVAIAIAGTFLSVLIGLPLGVLATPSLWRHGVLNAGEPRRAGYFFFATLCSVIRALLGLLRAIPDLMWGLLFVVAVGLGSLAGTLALAVSYCGVLGRVYAHVFDDVDRHALEALHSVGATRLQIFLRAIWPQALPSITGYTLYSFECCVRAASVLGFIGAGGIGYEINISMRMFNYGEVLTLLLSLVVLVAATDAFSRFVRRRLHANVPSSFLVTHQSAQVSGFRRVRGSWRTPVGLGKLAVVLSIILSLSAIGFFNGALLEPGLPGRVGRLIASMFPPDLNAAFLRSLWIPLLQTVGISVIGTAIGIAISVFLSLPATGTLVFTDPETAGRVSRLARTVQWFAYLVARLVLNLLRSIPELVWVLICIVGVGLGPFAGALAVGLHTGGVLGKLYAETLEEAPKGPIEALRANGARPLQILIWGMWPQVRPMMISYTLLRWESNMRISTILGLVGGGGLGQAIYNNIQLGFYQRITVLIAIIYLLVIITNWLGDKLRGGATSEMS